MSPHRWRKRPRLCHLNHHPISYQRQHSDRDRNTGKFDRTFTGYEERKS